jgi:predicted lactoylglutathione lyase
MSQNSFVPDRRIHISLDVHDLEKSIAFYSTLFEIEPSKVREDYAKFEPAEPAVNLALNLSNKPVATEGRVSHFGVQVKSTEEVQRLSQVLGDAGLETITEEAVTCCYAEQNKTWVRDPDGNAWEVFVVTQADSPVHSKGRTGPEFSCCPTEESSGCC